MSCAPLFDLENRLAHDECALADRQRQSDDMSAYSLASFYSTNLPACDKRVAQLAACHNNLRFRDGFGPANGCVIDADSAARLGGELTNSPNRQQLAARVFQGGPHLERGDIQPDKEAALVQAEISRDRRPCLENSMIDRFVPLIPCLESTVQNPDTIVVSSWRWGGDDTRAWVREADYAATCASNK